MVIGVRFLLNLNGYFKGEFLDGEVLGEGIEVASEYIYKGSYKQGVRSEVVVILIFMAMFIQWNA